MFKKGAPVNYIGNSGHQTQLGKRGKVHGCGEMQMVLANPAREKFDGRHFPPGSSSNMAMVGCSPISPISQAECIAEAMCEEIRQAEIEHRERTIKAVTAPGVWGNEGYRLAQACSIETPKNDASIVHWH